MVGELVVFKQKNNSAKQQFFPGSILCVCMCVSNNNECITASGYNADVCESLHVCVCHIYQGIIHSSNRSNNLRWFTVDRFIIHPVLSTTLQRK